MTRHPRACAAPDCSHRAPTGQALCLRCEHGGRLPTRLGAWAWRHAAGDALHVVASGVNPCGHNAHDTFAGDDRPMGWRPDPALFAAALRRVARCYRGAAYATAASTGLGERAR